MDMQQTIKLDLTLNEIEGVLTGLGELPTRSNAFVVMMKIRAQVEAQLPKEEPKAE